MFNLVNWYKITLGTEWNKLTQSAVTIFAVPRNNLKRFWNKKS